MDSHGRRITSLYNLPQQLLSHYQIHVLAFLPISFLDVKVSLNQFGQVKTDLHTKPTNRHHYLLNSSCHPLHTKRAIPFSLALRLLRICSSDETFTCNSTRTQVRAITPTKHSHPVSSHETNPVALRSTCYRIQPCPTLYIIYYT